MENGGCFISPGFRCLVTDIPFTFFLKELLNVLCIHVHHMKKGILHGQNTFTRGKRATCMFGRGSSAKPTMLGLDPLQTTLKSLTLKTWFKRLPSTRHTKLSRSQMKIHISDVPMFQYCYIDCPAKGSVPQSDLSSGISQVFYNVWALR